MIPASFLTHLSSLLIAKPVSFKITFQGVRNPVSANQNFSLNFPSKPISDLNIRKLGLASPQKPLSSSLSSKGLTIIKAPGPDNIHNFILNTCPKRQLTVRFLTDLCSAIPTPNKPNTDHSNYRLISAFSKAIEKFLTEKITNHIEYNTLILPSLIVVEK